MKTQPESKCPELLANYCDMLLRKTPLSKKLTSEEIELKLKEVVSVCPGSFTVHDSRGWFRFMLFQTVSFSSDLLFPGSPSDYFFLFFPISYWYWSMSRTKMCLCVITKLTWPDVWSWTFQPTARLKRTWWSGWEWVTRLRKRSRLRTFHSLTTYQTSHTHESPRWTFFILK